MRSAGLLALALATIAPVACSSQSDPGPSEDEARATAAPWTRDCSGIASGKCGRAKPYVCKGASPPQYDCRRCGCPTGETCQAGVCLANDTISKQRKNRTIPDDLPADDYFRFVDEMMREPGRT